MLSWKEGLNLNVVFTNGKERMLLTRHLTTAGWFAVGFGAHRSAFPLALPQMTGYRLTSFFTLSNRLVWFITVELINIGNSLSCSLLLLDFIAN